MAAIDSKIAPFVTIESLLDYAKDELEFVEPYIAVRAVVSPVVDRNGNRTGETEQVLNVRAYGKMKDEKGNFILVPQAGNLPEVFESETIWSARVIDDEMFQKFRTETRVDDATLRWGCFRHEDDTVTWAKAPRLHSLVVDGELVTLDGPKRAFDSDDTTTSSSEESLGDAE